MTQVCESRLFGDVSHRMLLLGRNGKLAGLPTTRLLNQTDTLKALREESIQPLVWSGVYAEYHGKEQRLPLVAQSKRYAHNSSLNAPAQFETRLMKIIRDCMVCHYTGHALNWKQATSEHIQPRSRNGRSSWMNNVTAFGPLNVWKSNRTPEECGLKLMIPPWEPTRRDCWDLFHYMYEDTLPPAIRGYTHRPLHHLRYEVRRIIDVHQEAVQRPSGEIIWDRAA
ncbi:MAG: HNH endonuclease domain-containing protein [Alphaproteobacteria bacterium]